MSKRGYENVLASGATAEKMPGDPSISPTAAVYRRVSPRTTVTTYATQARAAAVAAGGGGAVGDLITPTLSKLSSMAAVMGVRSADDGGGGGRGGGGDGSGGGRRGGGAGGGGSFFDLDFLESGMAKEVIEPSLLRLCSKDVWTTCDVREEKSGGRKCFRVYESISGRFLLSGIVAGTVGYISQYEAFPEEFVLNLPNSQQRRRGRYCCVVRRQGQSKSVMEAVIVSCENCDNRLCKYTCGGAPGSAAEELRQIIIAVEQFTTAVHEGVDVRSLSVALPRIYDDRWRAVWCPRCPKGSGLGRSGGRGPPGVATTPRGSRRGLAGAGDSPGGSSPPSAPMVRSLSAPAATVDDVNLLPTKMPWWNESLNSLSMRFVGSRITAASSRNFLVEDRSRATGDFGVLQFGKMADFTFTFECRGPFSILQGFATMVSSFIWLAKIDSLHNG